MAIYNTPEIEMIRFETEDVIRTSGTGGGLVDGGDNGVTGGEVEILSVTDAILID